MLTLPLGGIKEAANRIGFGRTVGAKGRFSDALRALLKLKSACSRTIQNASDNCLMRGAHHLLCAREGLTVVDYALLKANWQGEKHLHSNRGIIVTF